MDYLWDDKTGGHRFELSLSDPKQFTPQAVFAVIGAERTRLMEIRDRRVEAGGGKGKDKKTLKF